MTRCARRRKLTTAVRAAIAALLSGGIALWSGGAPRAQTPTAPVVPAAVSTSQAQSGAIGSVVTLQGSASVTRGATTSALKLKDAIMRADTLQTAADGRLGIAFDDATTFMLTPNARIVVDDFVYRVRGVRNAAVFDVTAGTVGFLASAVARTGDMKINTPTASIGIRGTSGVIEVPPAGTAGAVRIKLYADADGHVGRVEVFGRDGASLGALTRAATGFAIGPGGPGATRPVVAVPLQISAAEAERDRGVLRQAVASQQSGRRINRQILPRLNAPQQNPNRLNLVPPPGGSVGPTLLQPGTLPSTPSLPGSPQLPADNLSPGVPSGLPAPQPLPGPSTPTLPAVPSLPRLPGGR
jgi:hypothetical protein